MGFSKRHILNIFIMNMVIGIVNPAFALGLYIPYQSAADMGDGRSGSVAAARDASTNFTNAAGITRFKNPQFVFSAIGSFPYYTFTGSMQNPGFGLPASRSGQASSTLKGLIPAFHYVYPLTNKASFGISLIVPSGLGYDYPPNSLVRYDIVRTTLATTNLTPSFAYQLTSQFSVGVGPDVYYSVLKSRTAVRTQPFTPGDSIATAYASGIDYGWHAGLLYSFTPGTRVGLNYRSRATLNLDGQSRLFSTGGILPARSSSNNFKTIIPLASLIALSVYHELTPRWTIMGTFEYMDWSVYRNDKAYNVAGPTGPVDVITPKDLQNTRFYAIGGSYKWNEKVLLRGGMGYSGASTTNTTRELSLPDPAAFTLALGSHYQAFRKVGLDFAINHTFFQTVKLNHTTPATGNHLFGRIASGQTSLGAQVTWDMV